VSKKIMNHRDLDVYQRAFDASMIIFGFSKTFPKEERYALTDQIRRASRSVCGQIAEGWRRRRYEAAFINKLNEAEAEVAETQVWIEFAVRCEYMSPDDGRKLYGTYNGILRTLVGMINHPETWVFSSKRTIK
jgi:four helix bundle protein